MEFWKDRNVFVTGAAGFVGANLARTLVELGANVVCLRRDEPGADAFDLFGIRNKITVVSGALEDYQLMLRILGEYGIESVFHLAAQAIVGAANKSAMSTFESNVRGTYTLLEACRVNGSVGRIVVASSDKAYGTQAQLPYTEDQCLNGLFPYDASKACTDIIARSYARSFDLPVSVTRCANIYGPGDLNLSRVIPGTIVSVLKDEDPVVRSDGTPVRDFIYVEDAVRAYLMSAEKIEKIRGEAFNFGSNAPVQILDLVEKIIEVSGKSDYLKPNVLLTTKIEGEIDAQYLLSDRAMERLGWEARTGFDEGLARSIEWYGEKIVSREP
jgi:CDP-glucose 4,6-dehydratase